jgi:uncharacterized protein (TIGR03435 family)
MITVENMALRNLLMRAYKVSSYQVAGPGWLADTRFDIVAKVAPNSTNEQAWEMWRTLLAERFNLTLHRETKELPIYALVVEKGGPKFHDATLDDPSGGAGFEPYRIGPEKMPLSQLADMLARNVERPVIDQTGLTGRYLITLAWQRDDMPSAPTPEGPGLPSLVSSLRCRNSSD